MDGKKTFAPGWHDILKTLKDEGRDTLAEEIEQDLGEGRSIKAVQRLRAAGITIPEPPDSL